jgi:hypothetical protein
VLAVIGERKVKQEEDYLGSLIGMSCTPADLASGLADTVEEFVAGTCISFRSWYNNKNRRAHPPI